MVKTPNKPNQRPHPIVRTRRHVKREQPSYSITLEIDKGVLFDCDSTNERTERPVESEQHICLYFRVRELVRKIESHPHRRALQAKLQQNNTYNPFSEESKVMIREMGSVELFLICETIPTVQCSECLFLLKSNKLSIALVDIS